jgi:hypothetical protein
MLRISRIALLLFIQLSLVSAKEGMWLPFLIQQGVIDSMQTMGLTLSAEDLYSEEQASMKDAIVLFGGGCTAEFISEKGLLLTNHHCGLREIQQASSLENNYVGDGFWAKSIEEEIPSEGLSIAIMQSAKDLTAIFQEALQSVNSELERRRIIDSLETSILDTIASDDYNKREIKGFFENQQFYLIKYVEFNDVRYVGSPGYSIGKFGGETDNWVWPRHTGDFSLFRVYANTDNEPANYSEDNVPYTPKKHFKISAKGVQENDFTFVYGFPGRTNEYISSFELDYTMNTTLPMRIDLRTKRLDVMDKYMMQDEATKLNYISKYARVANGWKKFKGIIRGLNKTGALDFKRNNEQAINEFAGNDLMNELQVSLEAYAPLGYTRDLLIESLIAVELVSLANSFHSQLRKGEDISVLKPRIEKFFKTYNKQIDLEIAHILFNEYYIKAGSKYHPQQFALINDKYDGSVSSYVDALMSKTIFTSESALLAILDLPMEKALKKLYKDPVFTLAEDISKLYFFTLLPEIEELKPTIDSLNRAYFNLLTEVQPNKLFYPNANSTMRITFGKVHGYNARDAVNFDYKTTISGIKEKYLTGNIDYKISEEFLEIIESGNYGSYFDGETPVCFVASNHTSGGNSGSPLLDKDGNLVGLNFDRSWEGTMSDYHYDVTQCRNISVDLRYILFVIERVAKADNIIQELTILQ